MDAMRWWEFEAYVDAIDDMRREAKKQQLEAQAKGRA